MRFALFLVAIAAIAQTAQAGLDYQSPNFAFSYQLPAKFTFGFDRAGAETSLILTVPDDIATGGQSEWEATITEANAAQYGFDWEAFRAIASSTQQVAYRGWWIADRDLMSPAVVIPAGQKTIAAGATAANHYPAYFNLRFRPGNPGELTVCG